MRYERPLLRRPTKSGHGHTGRWLSGVGEESVTLLAELHGRMGYFPPCIRMRPVVGPDGQRIVPPRFEVAEILNLQAIRDEARRLRT